MFMSRRIATILLLVVLFVYSTLNFFFSINHVVGGVVENIQDKDLTPIERINNIESVLNENMYMRFGFIEFYGGIQLLLDKNEFDNVSIVKDLDGNLHYSYFATEKRDITTEAEVVVDFVNTMRETVDSRFLFLMPPDKEIVGETTFPIGIPYPFRNQEADDFLELILAGGLDYYDYRKTLPYSGIAYEDIFYSTDHHWRIDTAFWAYTELINLLNIKYGENIDPDYDYRNIQNYNQILYRDSYLGSLGRNTGIVYSGVDDFNLIYPKFQTDYTMSIVSHSHGYSQMQGSFDEVLVNYFALDGNLDIRDENADKYMAYLHGNYPLVQVKNNLIDDGLKVLFIKDSYSIPVAAFLTTVASQVDLIDPRHMYDGVHEHVLSNDYDYIILSMIPSNLTMEFFEPLKIHDNSQTDIESESDLELEAEQTEITESE